MVLIPAGVEAKALSHDPAVYEAYKSDPLVKMKGTVKGLNDMLSKVTISFRFSNSHLIYYGVRENGFSAPGIHNGQKILPLVKEFSEFTSLRPNWSHRSSLFTVLRIRSEKLVKCKVVSII